MSNKSSVVKEKKEESVLSSNTYQMRERAGQKLVEKKEDGKKIIRLTTDTNQGDIITSTDIALTINKEKKSFFLAS